ncbi:MAG: MerR family DNA-binding transcriptional regulator [Pseudomonadota bacterium]
MEHKTPQAFVHSVSAADSRTYTISELAREFGVTARALRFYEDKDLLHPARDGMTRVYSNRDRARLSLIMRGKRVGLPLADIREILDLYQMGGDQRLQLRATLDKFRKQVKELESQRTDIETALDELKKGIVWAEQQLEQVSPSKETAESVRAYDAVARAHLEDQNQ